MKICGYFFFGKGEGGGVITKSNFFFFFFFFFGGGGGCHFYTLLGVLRSRYRMGIFLGSQIFKYFWVYLIFLICFFDFFEGGVWVGGKQ